jgi:hypothetical protein
MQNVANRNILCNIDKIPENEHDLYLQPWSQEYERIAIFNGSYLGSILGAWKLAR